MESGLPSPSLLGRTVIVTGASRGLGRVIAGELALAGAELLLIARDRNALQESAALAPGAQIFLADLRDDSAPARILSEARRLWPRLDGLVNNAGVAGPIGTLTSLDLAGWRETFQVNFFAPVELCRLAGQWMAEHGGGSIVNLSGGGAASPRPRFLPYGCSKTALVRFTEALAADWQPLGVRVNAIAPGILDTAMTEQVRAAGPERAGVEDFQAVEPLKSGGGNDPAVAARLVRFLLSSQADGITGRLLSAVWDPWPHLPQHAPALAGSDIYTLRRILPEDRGKQWEPS